jgi:hypothetical protein
MFNLSIINGFFNSFEMNSNNIINVSMIEKKVKFQKTESDLIGNGFNFWNGFYVSEIQKVENFKVFLTDSVIPGEKTKEIREKMKKIGKALEIELIKDLHKQDLKKIELMQKQLDFLERKSKELLFKKIDDNFIISKLGLCKAILYKSCKLLNIYKSEFGKAQIVNNSEIEFGKYQISIGDIWNLLEDGLKSLDFKPKYKIDSPEGFVSAYIGTIVNYVSWTALNYYSNLWKDQNSTNIESLKTIGLSETTNNVGVISDLGDGKFKTNQEFLDFILDDVHVYYQNEYFTHLVNMRIGFEVNKPIPGFNYEVLDEKSLINCVTKAIRLRLFDIKTINSYMLSNFSIIFDYDGSYSRINLEKTHGNSISRKTCKILEIGYKKFQEKRDNFQNFLRICFYKAYVRKENEILVDLCGGNVVKNRTVRYQNLNLLDCEDCKNS